MKTKLILLAFISITIASCKKNEAELAQPQTSQTSMDEKVADLIKRADKNLYDEIYHSGSGRATNGSPSYVRGYFRIPGQDSSGGNVDNGFCMNVDMVCVAIVSAASSRSLSAGSLENNLDLEFTKEDNARLIINTDHPVVQNITEFKISNSNGGMNISYKQ